MQALPIKQLLIQPLPIKQLINYKHSWPSVAVGAWTSPGRQNSEWQQMSKSGFVGVSGKWITTVCGSCDRQITRFVGVCDKWIIVVVGVYDKWITAVCGGRKEERKEIIQAIDSIRSDQVSFSYHMTTDGTMHDCQTHCLCQYGTKKHRK